MNTDMHCGARERILLTCQERSCLDTCVGLVRVSTQRDFSVQGDRVGSLLVKKRSHGGRVCSLRGKRDEMAIYVRPTVRIGSVCLQIKRGLQPRGVADPINTGASTVNRGLQPRRLGNCKAINTNFLPAYRQGRLLIRPPSFQTTELP